MRAKLKTIKEEMWHEQGKWLRWVAPGRLKLPTKPNLTGSPPIKNTSGRRAQSVGRLPFSRCQRTEVSVKRVPGIVLIASAVAFLALVFGLLVGAVIVPWIASWLG